VFWLNGIAGLGSKLCIVQALMEAVNYIYPVLRSVVKKEGGTRKVKAT